LFDCSWRHGFSIWVSHELSIRFKFFSLFNTILLNTLLTYMKLIVSYPKILLFQYDASVNHKYKVFNQIIILTFKKKNCHIVLMKIFRSLVWNNSFFLFFSKAEIPIVHQCSGHRQKMQAYWYTSKILKALFTYNLISIKPIWLKSNLSLTILICLVSGDLKKPHYGAHGFQYFWSVPVLQFTIYRLNFLFKFEQFSWISYTTLFKIRVHTVVGSGKLQRKSRGLILILHEKQRLTSLQITTHAALSIRGSTRYFYLPKMVFGISWF
jgi:hypothetical protein